MVVLGKYEDEETTSLLEDELSSQEAEAEEARRKAEEEAEQSAVAKFDYPGAKSAAPAVQGMNDWIAAAREAERNGLPPPPTGATTQFPDVSNAQYGVRTGDFSKPYREQAQEIVSKLPPPEPFKPATVPRLPSGPSPQRAPSPPATGPLVDYARQVAEQNGVDPDIFVRQIQQESGFEHTDKKGEVKTSPAGARGIAQIVPKYHPSANTDDPYASLDYAAGLMANHLKNYGGDYRKALTAYNGGQGAVDKLNSGKPLRETQTYLDRILGSPPSSSAITFPVEGYAGKVDPHWGKDRGAADIFSAPGTPVLAAMGGSVVSASFEKTGGNNVLIQGDDGNQYYYAHLDDTPLVTKGQRVETGGQLGGVGDTGNAKGTGPHLHFGVGKKIKTGTGPAGGAGDADVTAMLTAALSGEPPTMAQPPQPASSGGTALGGGTTLYTAPPKPQPAPTPTAPSISPFAEIKPLPQRPTGEADVFGGSRIGQPPPPVPSLPYGPEIPYGLELPEPTRPYYGADRPLPTTPQPRGTPTPEPIGQPGTTAPRPVATPEPGAPAPATIPAPRTTPPGSTKLISATGVHQDVYNLYEDQAEAITETIVGRVPGLDRRFVHSAVSSIWNPENVELTVATAPIGGVIAGARAAVGATVGAPLGNYIGSEIAQKLGLSPEVGAAVGTLVGSFGGVAGAAGASRAVGGVAERAAARGAGRAAEAAQVLPEGISPEAEPLLKEVRGALDEFTPGPGVDLGPPPTLRAPAGPVAEPLPGQRAYSSGVDKAVLPRPEMLPTGKRGHGETFSFEPGTPDELTDYVRGGRGVAPRVVDDEAEDLIERIVAREEGVETPTIRDLIEELRTGLPKRAPEVPTGPAGQTFESIREASEAGRRSTAEALAPKAVVPAERSALAQGVFSSAETMAPDDFAKNLRAAIKANRLAHVSDAIDELPVGTTVASAKPGAAAYAHVEPGTWKQGKSGKDTSSMELPKVADPQSLQEALADWVKRGAATGAIRADVGTSIGAGVAGAGASQIGTDENTPIEERLLRGAIGFGAGLVGAQFMDRDSWLLRRHTAPLGKKAIGSTGLLEQDPKLHKKLSIARPGLAAAAKSKDASGALNTARVNKVIDTDTWRMLDDTLEELAVLGKPKADQDKFIKNALNKPEAMNWLEWVKTLSYGSMLSNPATHVINTLGSAYEITSNVLLHTAVTREVAAGALAGGLLDEEDRLRGVALGGSAGFTGRMAFNQKARHELAGEITGLFGGAVYGKRTFLSVFRDGPGADSYLGGDLRRGTARDYNHLGRILEGVSTFMAATDEVARHTAWGMELGRLAGREAAKTAPKNWKAEFTRLMQDPPREMMIDAWDLAERAVYRNELDRLGKALASFPAGFPEPGKEGAKGWALPGHVILPFVKTLWNISKRGLETSPLGLTDYAVRGLGAAPRRGLAGAATERDVERLRRGLVGTLLWGTFMDQAMEGNISAMGPDSEAERKLLRDKDGWDRFSVKIGGKWVSYAQVGPLAPVLASAAGYGEALRYKKSTASPWDVALDGMDRATDVVTQMTLLRGVYGLYATATNPGDRNVAALAADLLFRPIPAGALTRAVGAAQDPYRRNPEGDVIEQSGQYLKARSPFMGLREQVAPARSQPFGEPVPSQTSGVSAFLPFRAHDIPPEGTNPKQERLAKYGVAFGEPKRELGGLQLTADQYERYNIQAAKASQRQLSQIMASAAFRRADAVERANMLRNAVEKARSEEGLKIVPQRVRDRVEKQAQKERQQRLNPK